jgi:chromosome segregation ATPase
LNKETLIDKEIEFEDKMRTLQDLCEYKDEHITNLEENLEQLNDRLDDIEKDKEHYERETTRLSKDLEQTKANMTHYRNSCKSLSEEIKLVNEAYTQLENKYELEMKQQRNEIMIKEKEETNNELDGQMFNYYLFSTVCNFLSIPPLKLH